MNHRSKYCFAQALSAATCALLGNESAVAQTEAGWQTDAAILIYSEKGRVNVLEPTMIARKEVADDEFVSVQLVYDSLSGATPTGAAPASTRQTFTTPSCGGSYSAEAYSQPKRSFSDLRGALNLSWDKPISRMLRTQWGAHISGESDYASLGVTGGALLDVNNKNTTLNLSFGFDGDHVAPASGKPVALTSINSCGGAGGGEEEEEEDDNESIFQAFSGYQADKQVSSALVGVTQLLSPEALVQLNYSYTNAKGYLSDPYKIISVVSDNGEPLRVLYESRPDNHTWHSIFTKVAWGFAQDTLQASFRYFWDDWDISSKTLDFSYQFIINERFYIRPYLRHYDQTAAKFYRHSIRQTEAQSIRHVSADQRLGAFTGRTLGLRAGYGIGGNNEVYLRIARYTQNGDKHPADAIGNQQDFDMFPNLNATYTQLGINYQF